MSSKSVMKEPKLYENNNGLQRGDTRYVLAEYSSRIKWKNSARVLDVGCGDGSVTVQLLKSRLPHDFERLVGCDIAAEMIAHANVEHKAERIEFKVLDIANGPVDAVGRYDHVFSFYVLHWVQEQQKALSNIHSMLVSGGDCLLVLLGHMVLFDAYRLLARDPKWIEYMYDLEGYISPYQDSPHPEQDYRGLLKNAGFKEVHVECKNKIYVFESDELLKEAIRAINPFTDRMNPVLADQFLEDCVNTLRKQQATDAGGEEAKTEIRYNLIVAYAVK